MESAGCFIEVVSNFDKNLFTSLGFLITHISRFCLHILSITTVSFLGHFRVEAVPSSSA